MPCIRAWILLLGYGKPFKCLKPWNMIRKFCNNFFETLGCHICTLKCANQKKKKKEYRKSGIKAVFEQIINEHFPKLIKGNKLYIKS